MRARELASSWAGARWEDAWLPGNFARDPLASSDQKYFCTSQALPKASRAPLQVCLCQASSAMASRLSLLLALALSLSCAHARKLAQARARTRVWGRAARCLAGPRAQRKPFAAPERAIQRAPGRARHRWTVPAPPPPPPLPPHARPPSPSRLSPQTGGLFGPSGTIEVPPGGSTGGVEVPPSGIEVPSGGTAGTPDAPPAGSPWANYTREARARGAGRRPAAAVHAGEAPCAAHMLQPKPRSLVPGHAQANKLYAGIRTINYTVTGGEKQGYLLCRSPAFNLLACLRCRRPAQPAARGACLLTLPPPPCAASDEECASLCNLNPKCEWFAWCPQNVTAG